MKLSSFPTCLFLFSYPLSFLFIHLMSLFQMIIHESAPQVRGKGREKVRKHAC